MLVRALVLCLLPCAVGLLIAAPGCTNGTTPICTGDAGCGPDIEDGSLDVAPEVSPEQ
jgi:hypothetical protein